MFDQRLGTSLALALFTAMANVPAHAQRAEVPMGVSVETREALKDSYIFVFRQDVAAREVAGRARAMTLAANGRLGHVYSSTVRGFSARMSADAAERMMAANPSLAYYEHDAPVWALMGKPGGGTTLPPQTTPWGIARVNGGVDGTGLTAWVIDTGIDLDHADLNVDTARSANFARGRSADDGNGHGTHVAGTIAAIDNAVGVVGVAAGATVVPVRVLDNSGSGTLSGVIAGIDYVGANASAGDVANMSLGGSFSQALNDAVIAAADRGIKFAIAAGNESQFTGNVSPGSTEHSNVYTVSAIDSADRFASFSNFGNPPVDCAAPGVSVLSTWNNGGLNTISGTSMATPHVAGILLLGAARFDGTAIGDPDGNPDPICVH
ncbi:MAG: hypothetical protein Tsb008_13800 [Rhodothalassiaceae bacterium]